ncbi:hypothetical protein Kisp01_35790 [Kineosporia sp. NBRC 101677]|nr:hypothetical protein Kisp01_35790 [Kineosporia sp. NBRC 101677]
MTDLVALAPGGDPGQRLGVTADHGGVGAVDHADRDLPGERLDAGGDGLGRLGDREHTSAPGQGPQYSAAAGHDAGRVFQGEQTGHVGGGDLALAVPDHRGGRDAGLLPERSQGDGDREECGLDHVDALKAGRVVSTGQHVIESGAVPVQVGGEGTFGLGEPGRENGRRLGELTPHTEPLRALAGEDEDDAGVGGGVSGAGHDGGRGATGREVGEQVGCARQVR